MQTKSEDSEGMYRNRQSSNGVRVRVRGADSHQVWIPFAALRTTGDAHYVRSNAILIFQVEKRTQESERIPHDY